MRSIDELCGSFGALFQQVRERTGEAKTSSTVETVGGVGAVLLAILVWWFSTWYWALGVLLVGATVAAFWVSSVRKRAAPLIARNFARGLPAQARADGLCFEAALRVWLPLQQAELQQGILSEFGCAPEPSAEVLALMQAYAASSEGAALAEAHGVDPELAELDAIEAEEAAVQEVPAAELEGRRESKPARAQGAREPSKRAKRFLAAHPGACEPVSVSAVHYHPQMPGETASAPDMAIGPDGLYFVAGQVMILPTDCLKRVTIGEATDGFSVDAIVAKAFSALSKTYDVRVRVDFHIWLPVRNRGSYLSHSGMSFVIAQRDWNHVGAAWMQAAQADYDDDAMTCPACKQVELTGELVGLAAQLGFSEPDIRAKCQACKRKFVLDLGRGAWQART